MMQQIACDDLMTFRMFILLYIVKHVMLIDYRYVKGICILFVKFAFSLIQIYLKGIGGKLEKTA
jgi:hypothetical protein